MKLTIGTRGSKLALWQAGYVKSELLKHFPGLEVELKIIKTTGDLNLKDDLSDIGGKGVFVKEIEESLLNNEIDIAVHSLKDVPSILPEGLIVGSVLKRHNPFDVFISKDSQKIDELNPGAKVATGSLRRKFQLLSLSPDLDIVPIRGNIDTRLKKIHSEGLDGIVIAAAGLERLGLGSKITQVFNIEEMVPSPCQGIIGIECRKDDNKTIHQISLIEDKNTKICATLERSFLKAFGGDCSVPLGCYSSINMSHIEAVGVFVNLGNNKIYRKNIIGKLSEHEILGKNLAKELLSTSF